MKRIHRHPLFFVTAVFAVILPASLSAHDVVKEMAAAADAWLASLSDEQRAKATFEFKDEERENWHYIPKERNGVSLKDMRTDQRQLAHALLSTGMSHSGYVKAVTIMSLERILWELENKSPNRDSEKYHVSVFGKPSADKTWGWRVEGHHLSVNFTIIGGKIVTSTPSFFGANPGVVKAGSRKGLRALGREEDLGRALVTSLNDAQKKKAIIMDKAPREILTGGQRKVGPLEAVGVPASELNADQKKQLRKLIEEYVNRHRPALAEADLKKIEDTGFDSILFAWAGPTEVGKGHYYRVQGKTFVMEFANTQNGANHPHASWRDFENDFGLDLLREHYKKAH